MLQGKRGRMSSSGEICQEGMEEYNSLRVLQEEQGQLKTGMMMRVISPGDKH